MSKKKCVLPKKVKQIGPLILSQYRNSTIYQNIMSQEEHQNYIIELAKKYDSYKKDIDAKVATIKDKISQVNPLRFLIFLRDYTTTVSLGKISEIDFSDHDNMVIRALEYAISVLMSIECHSIPHNEEHDTSDEYFEILYSIIDMYTKTRDFIFVYSAKMVLDGIPKETVDYVTDQMLFDNVRGVRFQKYQIEHLSKLLMPQNDIILDTFGISVDSILKGLERLGYSISQGQIDNYAKIADKIEDLIAKGVTPDNVTIGDELHFEEFGRNIACAELNNVIVQTGWPECFVQMLSYEMGQADYYKGEYGGWPNENMPCHSKPFIRMEDNYYCFDYYSLFDNFYRVIQKALKSAKPIHEDTWAATQKNASETLVADIFRDLLPQCKIYKDNYYPHNKSMKNPNENDIIVIYEDVIFIVEVKAGSFTYSSALSDYNAHVNSIEALINKPASQCSRTIDYINSLETSVFYDAQKEPKFQVEKNIYSNIYSFCVTIDNFNEIAAKAEKTNAVNIQKHTIVISADDLRIYRDYFENPLIFLHYIEQRSKATEYKSIHFCDELDHLSAYIINNLYYLNAEDFEEQGIDQYNVYGYRKELEEYFIMSIIPFPKTKPEIKLPLLIKKIISAINNSSIKNKRAIASGLLDYDAFSKEKLDSLLQHAIDNVSIGQYTPIVICGANNYTIYVYPTQSANDTEERRYTLANLLLKKQGPFYSLSLSYNLNINEFVVIKACVYFNKDIAEQEIEDLTQYGQELVQKRIDTARESGHKIGRNDKCPCGSGKKYKRCCLNKLF